MDAFARPPRFDPPAKNCYWLAVVSNVLKLAGFAPTLALFCLLGCKDITRFSTEPGEAYCGDILKDNFVREGLPPSMRLRMTFRGDHIEDDPGVVSTNDHFLENTPLRPIHSLPNDPLWSLQFGEGRDRNFLYVVDPPDPANGPSMFAVVSFLNQGDAEVRLLRGAFMDSKETEPPSRDGKVLFAVFAPMHRERGNCGF